MNNVVHLVRVIGAWAFLIAGTLAVLGVLVTPGLAIPCLATSIAFSLVPEA